MPDGKPKRRSGTKVAAGPIERRTFSETARLIAIELIARQKPDPDQGLRDMDMEGRHRLLRRYRR